MLLSKFHPNYLMKTCIQLVSVKLGAKNSKRSFDEQGVWARLYSAYNFAELYAWSPFLIRIIINP